jgi:hypothetical protein
MAAMALRAVISALWFWAVWAVGGVAEMFLGVPQAIVLLPAFGAAAGAWIVVSRSNARTSVRRGALATDPRFSAPANVAGQPLEA